MRNNDEQSAIEQLFHEHYSGLCAFVHGYVGEWALAEELVQDVFFALWQRRGSLDLSENMKPYLYTAARNAAMSHLRRRGLSNRVGEDEARDVSGSVQEADADVALHELSDAIDAALVTLPERARLVFTLSRDGGLSYAEIALTLGISVKAVEANMTRALRILPERLAPFLERD